MTERKSRSTSKSKESPRRTKSSGGESTPPGPDRVLEFADSLQEAVVAEDERERELETWVTCRLEGEIFALPVAQVQEILRVQNLTRVPHAPLPVRGVTNMRGYVLPVVDLRMRLAMESVELTPLHRIMVISSKGRLIGLLVDGVEQVLQIDRLTVEPPPADVVTERSYYILGVSHRDGELVILLDADRVLQVRDVDEPGAGER